MSLNHWPYYTGSSGSGERTWSKYRVEAKLRYRQPIHIRQAFAISCLPVNMSSERGEMQAHPQHRTTTNGHLICAERAHTALFGKKESENNHVYIYIIDISGTSTQCHCTARIQLGQLWPRTHTHKMCTVFPRCKWMATNKADVITKPSMFDSGGSRCCCYCYCCRVSHCLFRWTNMAHIVGIKFEWAISAQVTRVFVWFVSHSTCIECARFYCIANR